MRVECVVRIVVELQLEWSVRILVFSESDVVAPLVFHVIALDFCIVSLLFA